MNLDIAQIFLEGALVIIGLYLAFFKSYFTEKGRNLATSEDIEKIQRKIESVRTELQYSFQSKLNLTVEERNSIVDAFATYNDWLSRIVDINYANPPFRFDEDEKASFSLRSNCYRSLAKVRLFCSNDEIVVIFAELARKTSEYEGKILAVAYQANYASKTDGNRESKLKEIKASGDKILRNLSSDFAEDYNRLIDLGKQHLKTLA